MNAPAQINAATDDPILVLMPGVSPEEYQQRKRIQSVRKIPVMQPGQALQLAWITVETATEWLFAPADLETITDVAEQCRRLLIVSDTAEELQGAANA